MYLTLCSILLTFSLTACSAWQAQLPNSTPPAISPPSSVLESDLPTVEETSELQLELTTEQGETILFALNDSNAAKSLFEQLPLSLDVEDYSDNEKIFYPPEKLDTSDTPLAKGPAGTLAYYAPWGDVAIYYGACGGAGGLYQLGKVVSGAEYISELSGVIQLKAFNSNEPSLETTPSENTNSHKMPSETIQVPPTQTETAVPSALGENTMNRIQITVDNKAFTAGTSLPESNRQITAQAGDIILYNGNQICVFYGSNSWSYTKLGKVEDLSS